MGKNLLKQIVGTVGQATIIVGAGAIALGATVIKNHSVQHAAVHHAGHAIQEIEKWKNEEVKK